MHPDVLTTQSPRAVAVRDLTDPTQGAHAIQVVLDAAVEALQHAWSCPIVVHRAAAIASVTPGRGADRGQRSPARTRCATTAVLVPPLLRRIAADPPGDVLLVCPGAVHPTRSPAGGGPQRGAVPHEVDLWRVRRGAALGLRDLAEMIGPVTRAVAPEFVVSAIEAPRPGATASRRVDVRLQGKWVEIGRCGVVGADVLREAGMPSDASALAMTLDLDRLVMIAKGVDDAALLRSRDAGIAAQMLDLEPYVPLAVANGSARQAHPSTASAATLADVRASIDDVDGRIVQLLAERRAYVVQAARFKPSVRDVRVPAREEQVIANVRTAATAAGIEPDLVEDLYRRMIERLVHIEMAAHPAGVADARAAAPG